MALALALALAAMASEPSVPVDASTEAPARLVLPDGTDLPIAYPSVLLPRSKVERCVALAREEEGQLGALHEAREALVTCRAQLTEDEDLARLQAHALRLERRGRVATGLAAGAGVGAIVLGVVLGVVLGGG